MSEFITVGEPLVVFCSTQPNFSIKDATNFNKVVGGAELNVAIGIRDWDILHNTLVRLGMIHKEILFEMRF